MPFKAFLEALMHRLDTTSIGQLFRSSRPGFTASSPHPILGMSDAIVPIRAIEFTSSGKWKYAQAPHDSKRPYSPSHLSTSLTLVTWNVDFMMPNASLRLTAALDYLQYRVFPGSECGQPPPCIILLQEIKAGDFSTLLAHPWVREWFAVVPGSADDGWPRGATYGTVTLVARNESMPLAGSTCVHFGGSRMARNALVTDVLLGGSAGSGGRVLRVVNTHLESLPEGTPQRVAQMGDIAKLLKKTGMLGGIVGGDMNAIAASDKTLASENGLTDAWEEEHRRGGADEDVGAAEEEDDDGGITWGYQPRTRYPPGRLDRILYTKNEDSDLKIQDVRRIAVGLEMQGGIGGWVSDHYGLVCQVRVEAQGDVSLEAEA